MSIDQFDAADDVLTQALDQIKAKNFERAGELLDTVNQAIVASPLGANGERPAADSITTRDLRDKLREIRTLPM